MLRNLVRKPATLKSTVDQFVNLEEAEQLSEGLREKIRNEFGTNVDILGP